ncbi:MAG: endonuclease [Planctomycetota bacterium]|nr:endonuclease [Planctomycetota bacterium]
MRMSVIVVSAGACCALVGPVARGQYEPPAGYYSGATGTGATLRTQLNTIIGSNWWSPGSTTHVMRSYDSARQSLALIYRDPNNPSNLIMIYTGTSLPAVWDLGVTWNREHTWPDSRGLGGSGMDYTDLHQLRPCVPWVNGARGNDPFGAGGGSYWDPQPSTNAELTPGDYVPGTNDRGEMARAMMYMDVRYDGTDPSTTDLVLVEGFPGANQMGDRAQLLQWHYSDPVNDTERRRNHLIWSNVDNPSWFQGNRNPFVDRPEFVWALWGPTPNESQLRVGSGPAAADGSSLASVSMRVIAGTSDARTVTIFKTGATPTTFDVTATGEFTVTGGGQGQAFVGGSQQRVLSIQPESVETPGVFTGALVVDNSDLTSAGAGLGVQDGNDTVELSLAVLTPSNPSLAADADVNSDVITTELEAYSGVYAMPLAVHNWGFGATGALMDVDIVSPLGGGFDVLGVPTSGVGGTPATLTLRFDTGATPGFYSQTFTIETSDEDIPGETTSQVTVTWNVTLVAPPPPNCPGDANGDGLVNFTDVTAVLGAWQQTGEPGLTGDANDDGVVNFADITSVLERWNAVCP